MTDDELNRLREEVFLLRAKAQAKRELRDAEAAPETKGGGSAGATPPVPAQAPELPDDAWARRPGETDRDFADRVQRQAEGLPEDETFKPSMSAFERAWREFEQRQAAYKAAMNQRRLPRALGRFEPPDFLIEALLRGGRL